MGLVSENISEQAHTLHTATNTLLLLDEKAPIDFVQPAKWKMPKGFCHHWPCPKKFNDQQKQQFGVSAPNLHCTTIQLLKKLAWRGMSGEGISKVTQGSLVHRLISRGTVDILRKNVESRNKNAAVAAVEGLVHMSRVRDCRLLLPQAPNGIALIGRIFQSDNLTKLGPTLMLTTHLPWEADWVQPLLDMQNPPLEQIVVQSATTAMMVIQEEAYSLRDQSTRDKPVPQQAFVNALLGTDPSDEANKSLQESSTSWKRLETDRACDGPLSLLA